MFRPQYLLINAAAAVNTDPQKSNSIQWVLYPKRATFFNLKSFDTFYF